MRRLGKFKKIKNKNGQKNIITKINMIKTKKMKRLIRKKKKEKMWCATKCEQKFQGNKEITFYTGDSIQFICRNSIIARINKKN